MLLLLAGCAQSVRTSQAVAAPAAADKAQTAEVVFILIRHAEKADDGSRDPELSAIGHARAKAIADALGPTPPLAIYVTQYQRTRQTATPVTTTTGVNATTYDAGSSAADFAVQLRAAHSGGMVLVVGHSNTIPAIASALCACAVAPIPEGVYDRWTEVRIGKGGRTRLLERRY